MVVALPGLLGPAVQRLKAQAPQTRVLIEEGDLTRLLPRLRVGELDVLVGRLEPGHAAPDLATEALYDEPMALVVRPGHALLAATGDVPGWATLATLPWVMPPHWATTRTKLHQLFYQAGVNPPQDVVDTTSFLALLSGVHQRDAVGFLAHSVARHMARDGLLGVLPVDVPMDLPPVGLITLRGRTLGAATVRLMACVRAVARER
jgi:DNA-binding transcriptional LysR family regulator